jgi:hypothetical protein
VRSCRPRTRYARRNNRLAHRDHHEHIRLQSSCREAKWLRSRVFVHAARAGSCTVVSHLFTFRGLRPRAPDPRFSTLRSENLDVFGAAARARVMQ